MTHNSFGMIAEISKEPPVLENEGEIMTQLTVANESFVKPYPQKNLDGELGLTLSDIAVSLGQLPSVFRSNFRRSFMDRANSLDLKIISFETHNSNGFKYDEYVVDVRTAKWIVSQSSTPLGERYALYLIDLEKKVDDLETAARSHPEVAQLLLMTKMKLAQIQHTEQLAHHELKIATHESRLTELSAEAQQLASERGKMSLSTCPKSTKKLLSVIATRARALGCIGLCGYIKNEIKNKFGDNARNRTMEDQVCLDQLDEMLEFAANIFIPPSIIEKMKQREIENAKKKAEKRTPSATLHLTN